METVVVLTAGTVEDPYSAEPSESWELDEGQAWTTEPNEREVTTIVPLEPRPSQEPTLDARNSVTSGYTAYLPEGDPITSRNRVRARGVVHDVLGDPAVWLGAGVVVQIQRTDG